MDKNREVNSGKLNKSTKKVNVDKRNQQKKKYIPPIVEMTIIMHESSICAGSARFIPGGPGGSSTPEVEDWYDGGEINQESDYWM